MHSGARGGPSIGHGCTHVHPITAAKKMELGVRFRAAGWEGRGIGRRTPVGSSSPANRPSLDEGFQRR
jgi:hypothetical protein